MAVLKTKNMHYLPGRVRLSIPGLKNNIQLAQKLSQGLSRSKGIISCHINWRTGKCLLYFEDGRYTLEELLLLLDRIILDREELSQALRQKAPLPRQMTGGTPPYHNMRYRDMEIEKLWAHVLFGGSALLLLLFKKRFRGASALSGNRWVYNFAVASTVISGYPLLRKGLGTLAEKGAVSQELLFGTLGYTSLLLRENLIGLTAVWMANLLSLVNNFALANSRREVNDLLRGEDLPVKVQRGNKQRVAMASELEIGDEIIFETGDKVPVTCEVKSGGAAVNQTNATGSHQQKEVVKGDLLTEGSIIQAGHLLARVKGNFALSPAVQYGKLVHEEDGKVNSLVLFTMVISLLTLLVTRNSGRAAGVLVAATPGSSRLITPLAMTGAIRDLYQYRIRINDPRAILKAGAVDTILFDKTGTLTEGHLKVVGVVPCGQHSSKEIIALAAAINRETLAGMGNNPILEEAKNLSLNIPQLKQLEKHDSGVKASYQDRAVLWGDARYLYQRKVRVRQAKKQAADLEGRGLAVSYLAVGGELIGMIGVGERTRSEAAVVIKQLREIGIKNIQLVSGDLPQRAGQLAEKLGISTSFAAMTAQGKAKLVEELKKAGHCVCVVGDGLNDAEAMAKADVAIGIYNEGYPAVIKNAHFIIDGHNLQYLPQIMATGKKINCTRKNNKLISSGISIFGLLGVALGTIPVLSSSLIPHLSAMGIIINCGLISFNGWSKPPNPELKVECPEKIFLFKD